MDMILGHGNSESTSQKKRDQEEDRRIIQMYHNRLMSVANETIASINKSITSAASGKASPNRSYNSGCYISNSASLSSATTHRHIISAQGSCNQ